MSVAEFGADVVLPSDDDDMLFPHDASESTRNGCMPVAARGGPTRSCPASADVVEKRSSLPTWSARTTRHPGWESAETPRSISGDGGMIGQRQKLSTKQTLGPSSYFG